MDAAFAPVFRYIDLFEQMVELPIIGDFPRVEAWRSHLSQRPSVIKVVRQDYPALLLRFVARRESWLGERAREMLDRAAA